MAKNYSINDTAITFNLPADESVVVDLATLPKAIIDKALQFAIPTLLRNATAGLLESDPAKATERVKARVAAWAEGKWSAKGESSAEPRTSILARALAEALGITPADAAKTVEEAVEAALTAAGVDSDSADADEVAKAKALANAIRKAYRETIEVAPIYARIQAETKKKAAEGKTQVSLKDLIKK